MPCAQQTVNIHKDIKRGINGRLSIRARRPGPAVHIHLRLRTTVPDGARHGAPCAALPGLRALNLSLGSYFQTVRPRRTPAAFHASSPSPACFCLTFPRRLKKTKLSPTTRSLRVVCPPPRQHGRCREPRQRDGVGALRRPGQRSEARPLQRADERGGEPDAQRPLQPVPDPHPEDAERGEEGHEGPLLPQRRPLLQRDSVRHLRGPVPDLRRAAGRSDPLSIRQCQPAPGGPDHLHPGWHQEDRQCGSTCRR